MYPDQCYGCEKPFAPDRPRDYQVEASAIFKMWNPTSSPDDVCATDPKCSCGVILNGDSIKYWDTGEPKTVTRFSRGIEHGSSKTFYRSGQKKGIFDYQYGQKQGPYEYYHEDGRIKEEGSYENGQRSTLVHKQEDLRGQDTPGPTSDSHTENNVESDDYVDDPLTSGETSHSSGDQDLDQPKQSEGKNWLKESAEDIIRRMMNK